MIQTVTFFAQKQLILNKVETPSLFLSLSLILLAGMEITQNTFDMKSQTALDEK